MASPLRIGVIGAGRISRKRLLAAREFPQVVQLAAVCDPNLEAAQAFAREAGIERIFTDHEQMLREVELDAVDICSVSNCHAQQTLAALAAGKHVLVEKPMACSMADCRAMVVAASTAGRTLMVAHNQRYMANYRAVRKAIAAGELGAIRAVRVESMASMQAPPGHWSYDGLRGGGGVLMSLAVHRLDLARFFAGDIRRVSGLCRTTRPQFVNGAEDYVAAMLEFESGAIGELFATWSAFRIPHGESFVVFGEKGTIHALPELVRYHEPSMIASQERTPQPPDRAERARGFVPLPLATDGLPHEDIYVNEILHFADCCRTGQEPISSGRDNLGTMAAVFAIYESSRRGAPVEVEHIRNA